MRRPARARQEHCHGGGRAKRRRGQDPPPRPGDREHRPQVEVLEAPSFAAHMCVHNIFTSSDSVSHRSLTNDAINQ